MKTGDGEKSNISIAVIGNYLPRQCGIATFTSDLCQAIDEGLGPKGFVSAVVMDDQEAGYPYPDRVKFQVRTNILSDYLRASEFINIHQFDVVILQHEYGIFGGKKGSHILYLLKNLSRPLITTLHTVLKNPDKDQKAIILELTKYSFKLVVMTQKARELLMKVYEVPAEKIEIIHHGIPDIPFVLESSNKSQFDVTDKKMLLTFGLLSPGKGIESMIRAMPEIVSAHPDVVYIVLGATHPHIIKEKGDEYRNQLQQTVNSLGLSGKVRFHNQFVSLKVLCEYIDAADIYITPYINPEQIVSGTLAYAFGSGKAVVSTPYWYAEELLSQGKGRLVPFNNSKALATEIISLLSCPEERLMMREKAYAFGRLMIWKEVGQEYIDLCEKAIKVPRIPGNQIKDRMYHILAELPELNLTHLKYLTDDTGMFQHTLFGIPNRGLGYCVDDNARALVVASMSFKMNKDEELVPLILTYLAFLFHAFNQDNNRFRNFFSYDREWLEIKGSEDAHGRAVWGLGCAVKNISRPSIRDLAVKLFNDGLIEVENFTSPRAWAYVLLGINAYLEVYSGDSEARRIRAVLGKRLYHLFQENQDNEWKWCEDVLAYGNAKLCEALISSGQWMPDWAVCEMGLISLKWLLQEQTAPEGHLSVVGNGWVFRKGERSRFDQQPIEAMALVEACAQAYHTTGDETWVHEAKLCFEWFLGQNDLRISLYDFKTGGCCDGLQPHGVNRNQGAESTLAWLISLLTMINLMGEQVLSQSVKTSTKTENESVDYYFIQDK